MSASVRAPPQPQSLDFTIPVRTPFALTGGATDSDGDALTYMWEQKDRGGGAGTALTSNVKLNGPLFRQFNAWGLTNNYLALILPNVTFTLPICIWTLTAFFSDLPAELEEAARVDGCTRMQAFYKIVVPLARVNASSIGSPLTYVLRQRPSES